MDDRKKLIELITSQQVTNAEFYNQLCKSTPLLSKLMMDKFKQFLDDTYFTDLERQTMFMTFLEKQTNIDIIQEVLDHVQNCDCKDDYTQVIMEWTYHNSDSIVQRNLEKVDGAGLYGRRKRVNKLVKPETLTDQVLEDMIALTTDLIDMENGDGGEDDSK